MKVVTNQHVKHDGKLHEPETEMLHKGIEVSAAERDALFADLPPELAKMILRAEAIMGGDGGGTRPGESAGSGTGQGKAQAPGS